MRGHSLAGPTRKNTVSSCFARLAVHPTLGQLLQKIEQNYRKSNKIRKDFLQGLLSTDFTDKHRLAFVKFPVLSVIDKKLQKAVLSGELQNSIETICVHLFYAENLWIKLKLEKSGFSFLDWTGQNRFLPFFGRIPCLPWCLRHFRDSFPFGTQTKYFVQNF